MILNNPLQTGMKGAFYGRHSTEKQDMDAQKSSARSYVQKHGCEIGWYYEDGNVSAVKTRKEERPALNRLLKDAKKGIFDFIVIASHDRFARSPMEHQDIRKELRESNIPVYISTTHERYDIGDLLSQIIKDGVSKLEADNTRLRTKNTLESFVKNGKWPGGKVPYGYRYEKNEIKDDKKTVKKSFFVLNEKDAAYIRLIFDLYQKDYGFQMISNKLNEKDNAVGWNKNKIKTIITNPFYAGYLSINRKKSGCHSSLEDDTEQWIIKKCDYIPAVITKEEWDNCWRIYQQKKAKINAEREKKKINGKYFNTTYFFRGLIKCKQCSRLLECKNQVTTSSTGKHYGSRIYLCKGCKLRVEAQTLHSLNEVIGLDIASNSYEELQAKISKDYSEQQVQLESQITLKESNLDSIVRKIASIDEQLSKLIRQNNKDNEEFIMVLSIAKNGFDQEKDENELLILDLKKQKEAIVFLLKNKLLWKHWVDELFLGDPETFNTEYLRRFFLYYVKQLTIDSNGDIELETNHFPNHLYYRIDL